MSDTSPPPVGTPDIRLLVDTVVDYAIFMLDPDGHIISWNAGAERIKGYKPHEILGQHFSVFYPDEDNANGKPAQELHTAITEGRVEDEGWRIRKDGTRFWANVVITALRDKNGQLRGFGKVTRDLTERRTNEQALNDSEERFRLLIQNVVDYAIFMLDPDGHIISWNAGAERIKGYKPHEILGQHFSVFYPDEDNANGKPAQELHTAITEGRVEDEGWRIRKDGTRFWANVVITALRDKNGQLRGFGKVTRDLTERRTNEQALNDSEERFRLLIQNVVDYAIFMLDPDGHIISWNAGAERIKGYKPHEILGQHFSVFYPDEDNANGKPAQELHTAITEGRVEDEGWRIRKDGTRFWANVVITALRDKNGQLRGFGKVTRDLTERRTAEQALHERRRLLGHLVQAQELERRRIAWDVHDDSIQSMVAVGMRLQLLAGRLPEEEQASLARLDDAVRATIARLRTLVFRLRPTAIDRHGLVAALTDYLRDVVSGWDVEVTMHHEELTAQPPTETAITIFRICQEALTNVHKHAQANRVDIHLSTVDGGTTGRVIDDGVGYSRVALPPAEHFGLIEMRERAETAGGWLSIRGVQGGGTTVEFWLPSAGPAPDVPS